MQAAWHLLGAVCRLLALLASAIVAAVARLLALRCWRLPLLAAVPIAAKAACATSRSTLPTPGPADKLVSTRRISFTTPEVGLHHY